jgi:hypothetical protein
VFVARTGRPREARNVRRDFRKVVTRQGWSGEKCRRPHLANCAPDLRIHGFPSLDVVYCRLKSQLAGLIVAGCRPASPAVFPVGSSFGSLEFD